MTAISSLYNKLPSLGEAEEKFADREEIFAAVSQLFARYNDKFGLCLVHAHCELAENEIMLATGKIAQPVQLSAVDAYYPERWLATGEPYEFTSRPTETPPPDLLEDFRLLIGPREVLGLYFAGRNGGAVEMERTEGRKNIMEDFIATGDVNNVTETGWIFPSSGPNHQAQKVCVKYCDSRVTRSGTAHHKGFKPHVKQESG